MNPQYTTSAPAPPIIQSEYPKAAAATSAAPLELELDRPRRPRLRSIMNPASDEKT
jgi:hypothetical protein